MKQINTMSLFTAVKTAAGSEIKLSDHETDKVSRRREDLEIVITGRFKDAYENLVRYARRYNNPMCDDSDRARYQRIIDVYQRELLFYERILNLAGYTELLPDMRRMAIEHADNDR